MQLCSGGSAASPREVVEASWGEMWRYAGEYFDRETGNYYLRARYFTPRLGRFTQEDIYWRARAVDRHHQQGINLYSYCVNNPIKWKDPSGLIIQLCSGNDYTQNQTIRDNMQSLTNYVLIIVNGRIEIAKNHRGEYIKNMNNGSTLTAGNTLVSRMIESSNTVTIQYIRGMANAYAFPCGSTILFNASFRTSTAPSFISLAHEMIHVDRIWRGQFLNGNAEHRYEYDTRWSFFRWKRVETYKSEITLREELATIGLSGFDFYINGIPQSFITDGSVPSYVYTDNITVNHIRAEHGFPLRTNHSNYS